jgi:hypothetical protein
MVARRNKLKNPWEETGGATVEATDFVNIAASPANTYAPRNSTITPGNIDIDPYAVPPEMLTEKLIQRYFSDAGMLFPYIHQATFLENYKHMRKCGSKQTQLSFLGLFNMLLAVATNMTEDSELDRHRRAVDAQIFYQRGVGLCDRIFMSGSSLETVQLLLLMTQYLQATQKSVQTRVMHSLAVDAALQIGLHSPQASRHYSPFEQEMRKRVWYMCMLFDR